MLHVGDEFVVTSEVSLGILTPAEVSVEVYHGNVSSDNLIGCSMCDVMTVAEDRGNGSYLYSYKVKCKHSGRYGFTVRVMPAGDEWKNAMPGFITWPEGK
jgi:starch phosphorylase